MAHRVLEDMRVQGRGFHLVALELFIDCKFNRNHVKDFEVWVKDKVELDPDTGEYPPPTEGHAHVQLRGQRFLVPNAWGVSKFMDVIRGINFFAKKKKVVIFYVSFFVSFFVFLFKLVRNPSYVV
jgi:hypothetical protein